VAVKQLAADTDASHHMLALRREIKYLRTMDHPNVLRYIGLTSKGDAWLFMVTELMLGGNLHHLIGKSSRVGIRLFSKKRATPNWCHISSLILQLAEGLSFLHRFSMVHCDIKPTNLLLSEDWSGMWLSVGWMWMWMWMWM
jgi:serine/threonine protein kinase